MQPTKESIKAVLDLVSPEREFTDNIATEPVLQVLYHDTWVAVDEETFDSWTGLRRKNGEDYHGAIRVFGSNVKYTGVRSCGCRVCEQDVSPKFKMN